MKKYLDKHRIITITLLVVLTILVLIVGVRLPELVYDDIEEIRIDSAGGVYDLTEIVDWSGKYVYLDHGDVYYPNQLITPETIESGKEVSVDRYETIRSDYLSQGFKVDFPDNNQTYKLYFDISGRHAITVYINGVLIAQTGQTGRTKEDTQVWENNITCYATPKEGHMDIIVQTAQFYHEKSGARLVDLKISSSTGDVSQGLTGEAVGFFVMGIFICAAILLLWLYLVQSHTMETLYFVFACLAMALRECLQSQAWTWFSWMNGNVAFMLEYLSVVLLGVFLSLYLGQYAVKKYLKVIQYTAIISSLIYGMCVLFTDSLFYTSVLKYYQIILVICIVPGVIGLVWEMRKPNKEQAAAIYGIAVFYLAAVMDILMYNDFFGNMHPNLPISEGAMIVFAIAQTVSLFLISNRRLAELQRVEEKLEAEARALKKLNQLKTEFLGNVSHELKTPLTVMSGYAQTTKNLVNNSQSPDLNQISEQMKLISSEAERLSLMVTQVLDVTRMEEGRMAMNFEACYMDEIIHKAVETHYPLLKKNSNELKLDLDTGISKISGDPNRLSQVIVNLISNAVRFTVNGQITISVKGNRDGLEVCVADTGTGIDPDFIDSVFDRYNTKSPAGHGKDTGTGLGLYICKHIVEEHGGTIGIESKLGIGTKVYFTLPYELGNAHPSMSR